MEETPTSTEGRDLRPDERPGVTALPVRHLMEYEPEHKRKMLERRHTMAPDPDWEGPSFTFVAWAIAVPLLALTLLHLHA